MYLKNKLLKMVSNDTKKLNLIEVENPRLTDLYNLKNKEEWIQFCLERQTEIEYMEKEIIYYANWGRGQMYDDICQVLEELRDDINPHLTNSHLAVKTGSVCEAKHIVFSHHILSIEEVKKRNRYFYYSVAGLALGICTFIWFVINHP